MVRPVILLFFSVLAVVSVIAGDSKESSKESSKENLKEKSQTQKCVCDKESGVIESLFSFHNAAMVTIDNSFNYSASLIGLGITWTEVKGHGFGLYVQGTEVLSQLFVKGYAHLETVQKSTLETGNNIALEQLGKEQVDQLKSQAADLWDQGKKHSDVVLTHADIVKTHAQHVINKLTSKQEIGGLVLEQGIIDIIVVFVYLIVLCSLMYQCLKIALKCSCLVLCPLKLLFCILTCGLCCRSRKTSLPPSEKRGQPRSAKKNGLSSPPPAMQGKKPQRK